MKEGVRQQTWGNEMSATVLSAFYDMDMLYKVKKNLKRYVEFSLFASSVKHLNVAELACLNFSGVHMNVFSCNKLLCCRQTKLS